MSGVEIRSGSISRREHLANYTVDLRGKLSFVDQRRSSVEEFDYTEQGRNAEEKPVFKTSCGVVDTHWTKQLR